METPLDILQRRVQDMSAAIQDMSAAIHDRRDRVAVGDLMPDLARKIVAIEQAVADMAGVDDVGLREGYREVEETYASTKVLRESHESYGMVRLGQCTGKVKLFGSGLDHCPGFIEITISRGVRVHDETLMMDRYTKADGTQREVHIATVRLSAQQFAEFITSPGMGDGIPCTLHAIRGVLMQPVPEEHRTTLDKIEEHAKKKIREAQDLDTDRYLQQIDEILAKPNIGKADRTTIANLARCTANKGKEKAEWALEMTKEALEKGVSAVRSEVEASLQKVIHQAGLLKLGETQDIAKRLLDGETPR